jgi:hypothetical protein
MALLVALVTSALGLPGVALAVPHSVNEVPASQPYAASRTFSETGFTVADYFLQNLEGDAQCIVCVWITYFNSLSSKKAFHHQASFIGCNTLSALFSKSIPTILAHQYYILGRLLGSKLASARSNEPASKAVADPGDGTFDGASSRYAT